MDDYIERKRLPGKEQISETYCQGEVHQQGQDNLNNIINVPVIDYSYNESRIRPLSKGDLVNVLEGHG